MKHILYFLTITTLKAIVWLWCFEWWSTEKLSKYLSEPVPMYFVGAFHFGFVCTILTWLIVKSI